VLARGAPTSIEHLSIPARSFPIVEGPGLPKLRRVDFGDVRPRYRSMFDKLDEVGAENPAQWNELIREREARCAFVLCSHAYLNKLAPSAETPWELVCRGVTITARPQVGSTMASLQSTLVHVREWDGITLRVPNNFVDAVDVKAKIEPIDPVEPARLGISLDLL
jgi:hypothetical protein